MNEITIIKEAIQRINPRSDNYSVVCEVSDVDTANSICNCTPIDGSAILVNVRFNSDNKDGFKLIPKDGSKVLVTLINNTTGYVAMVSEVDEIHLNGINEDGLVKVNDLVTKINALENLVNNILTTLKATTIPLAPSGTYPFAPLYTAFNNIAPITNKADLENTKVLHGS